MSFINISQQKQIVSFKEAVLNPVGDNKGIFFPITIPKLERDVFSSQSFHQVAIETLYNLTFGELSKVELEAMVSRAFNFPMNVHTMDSNRHVLELFHGPTLAFKDFGARFLAECLASFNKKKATIVTATSGDTGAAVAHAFHGKPDIDVVILYPKGKISKEQEQMFCTLGGNIHTIKVDGDFDACQYLVKQAFNDEDVRQKHNLNSANSINIARLLAQVCYYNALPLFLDKPIDKLVVPSGNFGNITAAVIAKAMGTPIEQLLAATNINDTVPRFFKDKSWTPRDTQRTLSNAMDVSQPNNFARILYYYQKDLPSLYSDMSAISVNDEETREIIQQQEMRGYLVDPHTAVGLKALQNHELDNSKTSVVVSTAHPAKFADVLEPILQKTPELPEAISSCITKTNLSSHLDNNFDHFKEYLLAMG